MPGPDAPAATAAHERHWRANRALTARLLALWALVSFVAVYFARDLSFSIAGWPVAFWVAAQGALLVYLAIVWWYAHRLQQLDHACGVAEDD